MNPELEAAGRILKTIAAANEDLVQLAIEVKRRDDVMSVVHNLDFRSYRTGPMIEAYVEATLRDGNYICWWLDLHPEQSAWLGEATIRIGTNQGEDPLWKGGEKPFTDLSSLEKGLLEMAAELRARWSINGGR